MPTNIQMLIHGFVDELRKLAGVDVSRFEQKLEPGDILVTDNKPSAKQVGIRAKLEAALSPALQGSRYVHSAMYVGDGKIVESMPGEGVKEKSLDMPGYRSRMIALRPRLPEEDRTQAAQQVKSFVGQPYGYGALPKVFLADKSVALGERLKAHGKVCSTIVSDAYGDRIKFNPNKPDDALMPKDLMQSRRTRIVARLGAPKEMN